MTLDAVKYIHEDKVGIFSPAEGELVVGSEAEIFEFSKFRQKSCVRPTGSSHCS